MTSTITEYDPTGIETAGMSRILAVDAIASIQAAKITELDVVSTLSIECALDAFGSTTSVSYKTRKKLCDKVASQRPSERTYEMEPLVITLDDLQGVNQAIIEKFALDKELYLVHRPGVDHRDALAVGENVQIIHVIVAAADLVPLSSEAGQEYELQVALSVLDRTQLFSKLVA